MLYFNIYFLVLQAKIEKMIKHKSHYHCVYNLKYHLVLVTKYRKKCFTAEMLQRLEQICKNLCTMWEIELIEFGGEADHAHLLLDMHPNIMPRNSSITSKLFLVGCYAKNLPYICSNIIGNPLCGLEHIVLLAPAERP